MRSNHVKVMKYEELNNYLVKYRGREVTLDDYLVSKEQEITNHTRN